MPGIAHVVIALGVSVVLFIASNGKFSAKHAIIFSVNNLVGPDLFGVLDYRSDFYVFFHGMGWFVAAVPIALAWSLFTRYSLTWRPFTVARRDPQKEHVIALPEVFCLVAAGGIFHLFVDLVGHPPYIPFEGVDNVPWGAVWFGGDSWFTVESIWGTGIFPCGNEHGFVEFYLYIGITVSVALVLVFFIMQRSRRAFLVASACIAGIAFVPLAVAWFIPDVSGFDVTAPGVTFFGDPTDVRSVYRLAGGEADLGVLVYYGLFMLVPLILLLLSFKGIPGIKPRGYRALVEQVDREKETWAAHRLKELMEKKE